MIMKDVPNHHLMDSILPNNKKASSAIYSVQIKFEAVLVTVVVPEEEDAPRVFTFKVHINALNKKTRRNEEACAR